MRGDLTAVLAGVTLLACVVLVVAYLTHRREVKVDRAHAVYLAKRRHPSSLTFTTLCVPCGVTIVGGKAEVVAHVLETHTRYAADFAEWDRELTS